MFDKTFGIMTEIKKNLGFFGLGLFLVGYFVFVGFLLGFGLVLGIFCGVFFCWLVGWLS